jgi:hypothetical protein
MVATLGIDLSSQPKNTAICELVWTDGGAEIAALWQGTDPHGKPLRDEVLVAAMIGDLGIPQPSKVAIDAPLGWPLDFVRGLSDPATWPVKMDESRARLERRATDHWVHRRTGKQPLSVTTDRIAYAAMRAAGLLAHCARALDQPLDRTGMSGLVCEAYPDPAIRCFDIWPPDKGPRQSYKGDAQNVRNGIIHELANEAPWLRLADVERSRCIESDDCLDALICALVARAVQQGVTDAPPDDLLDEAAAEGWIHLPRKSCLAALL